MVNEFYRLKVFVTLEQLNTSVVKKKKNLDKQNDGEAYIKYWLGVVIKLSLYPNESSVECAGYFQQ